MWPNSYMSLICMKKEMISRVDGGVFIKNAAKFRFRYKWEEK